MKDVEPQPRSRGRPRTGTANTATERVKLLDQELLASGGRILNRLRLSPAATIALSNLRSLHDSDRAAIEEALIKLDKRTRK